MLSFNIKSCNNWKITQEYLWIPFSLFYSMSPWAQSMRPKTLKEWSYRVIIRDRMTGNSYLQFTSLHTSRWHWAFHIRLHVDGDILLSYTSVNLLVWGYLLKISLLFLFSISYTATTSNVFSHQICPHVTPTHKCENDLVWTGIYTAGKFHHVWTGDLVLTSSWMFY